MIVKYLLSAARLRADKMLPNVFFGLQFVNAPTLRALLGTPPPSPLRLFAVSEKFAYLCNRWNAGRRPLWHSSSQAMDKQKAELIQIIWTVVKVAIGYLIGYITNNPEVASQVAAFLNY